MRSWEPGDGIAEMGFGGGNASVPGEQAGSGTPGPARRFITPLGQLTLG